MGILNRTPDSFYDKGATFELDKLYGRAEQLVADGADILDIGGVKAGPGPEVTKAEELDAWSRSWPAWRRASNAHLGRHLARRRRTRLVRRGCGNGQRHHGLADPTTRPPPPSTRPPSSSRTSVSPRGWPIPTPPTTTS